MVNCLRDYIDVWDGCSEKDPEKFYVNDIPGFTLDVAESITTSETQSALELIRAKIDFACKRVESDIRNSWKGKVYMGNLLDNSRLGIIQMNKQPFAAIANVYQGIQLNLLYSPFAKVYVNNVQFFTQNAETVNLKVYNINTGELIDTFSNIATLASEVTTVNIKKEYKPNGQPLNLAFLIESVASYSVQLWSTQTGCGSCRDVNTFSQINSYAWANQIQVGVSSHVIDNNCLSSASTGGLSVTYSILCDNTDFLCSIAPMMKLAMMYASGIDIMAEILFSRRLNTVTTIDRDRAEELSTLYSQWYASERDGILNNLILPKNICFQCDAKIQNVTRIP